MILSEFILITIKRKESLDYSARIIGKSIDWINRKNFMIFMIKKGFDYIGK